MVLPWYKSPATRRLFTDPRYNMGSILSKLEYHLDGIDACENEYHDMCIQNHIREAEEYIIMLLCKVEDD